MLCNQYAMIYVKRKMKSFRLSESRLKRLGAYAASAGLSETELVERALDHFLGEGAEALLNERVEAVRKTLLAERSEAVRKLNKAK